MKATQVHPVPARLTVVATLARLLQSLELSPHGADPQQYRSVAQRLAEVLREVPADEALNLVLAAFPAAGELYENLQYEHAGLCRAPLELSLNTELKAREVIDRVRH
jgi:hypothetical protein